MFPALRTYRFLAALLGLSVLFSAAAPLAQATCAMEQGDRHGDHDCRHEKTHSHSHAPKDAHKDAPEPPCPHEAESAQKDGIPPSPDTRPCCAFESASTAEAAALLSRTASRDASHLFLAPLPDAGCAAPDNAPALSRISAPPRDAGFPPIDRQALLATFLI